MNKFMRTANGLVFAAIFISGWNISFAQDLAAATERALLTVSGNIKITNAERNGQPVAEFDRALLESIGTTSINTSSDWTEGVVEFSGPLARDLLAKVGAEGETVVAIALNDYKIDIPMSDFLDYPVLLATSMNGKQLTRRDKGPIWVVYPRDDYPELANPETNTKWIWQLKELVIP